MPIHQFTLLFAAALLASMLVKFWLASRQLKHVAAHRGAVPSAFETLAYPIMQELQVEALEQVEQSVRQDWQLEVPVRK